MGSVSYSNDGFDYAVLNKELDRTKSKLFQNQNNAGFFGPLMCYLDFQWSTQIDTAATNGVKFIWNPKFFLYLSEETRKTVLMHELRHVAYLHSLRLGARDPLIWNYAADIIINNELTEEGYSFVGIEDCWRDPSIQNMSTEEVYELLMKQAQPPPPGGAFGSKHGGGSGPQSETKGDLLEPTKEEQVQVTSSVIQAAHAARMAGLPGSIPGEVETTLKNFLAPIVPWESLLYRFFQELMDLDYSWQVRDRRYQDIYLPGEVEDEGRLEHLIYYLDVSGSISDNDIVRFNSEVKYIKDVFKPKKLTLVQFDTRITKTVEFEEDEPFEELVVVGRGGTDLRPVREHILEHKPTAAIIFSDLWVEPMEALDFDIPIIWICIDNKIAEVPFGELIHISG